MLDAITSDDEKKQHLLQGEVIDKAERLSKCMEMLWLIDFTTNFRTSPTDTRKTGTVSRST